VVNAPVTDDPRFERLPKWVKDRLRARDDRIQRLEQELATARKLLNDGPEDANVIVDPYGDNRQPLFDRPTVAFQFRAEGERYERYYLVRLMEDNRLEVHASAGIVIHPSSGNAVKVEVRER
jgi:hypothetical protein